MEPAAKLPKGFSVTEMEVNFGTGGFDVITLIGEFCPDASDDVFDEHDVIPKIITMINPVSRQ